MQIESGSWRAFRVRLPPCLVLACLAWCSPAGAQPNPTGEPQAKIESLRNQVDSRRGPAETWAAAVLHEELAGGHRVRTGPASRAGILYSDQTLQRLNENSELEIIPPTTEKPGFLRLLFGKHYFSSRRPEELKRIETPTVVASIRGTEFVVEVTEDGTTTITLLEGVVEASNPFGSVTVSTGEQAYVEPGKAPVKRIVVRPRDAVVWALYYPAVLGGSDARRLDGLGTDGRDLAQAAALLAAGQVEQATPLIEAVLARRPDEPIALSLSAVTRVAAADREGALRLSEAAVAADPNSPAAALALSFASQAAFDIPRARAQAERAAELDPQGSLALARAAELRMAEGNLKRAEIAATEAVQRDPGQSRALSVLGFVKLAQFRTAEAETLFERAVAADTEFSTARLGLGLARIRRGRVDEGRGEIQIASALDPGDSLLRSYLGKVYYEQKRSDDAGKEFAAAKELDPNDPTPYLYDAIRKQNENRPAEALADLLRSIERNDNRAVYRSRQLLDEDRAVRGADLARIYNDLGFNQLGVVTARRSADEDHSNYSAHNLLAGTYRSIPGFAPAFFSEVLQARIYQPVSVNAARPDVVNETVSLNEYTALFDRPRKRLFATATYGETDTDLSELIPMDDPILFAFLSPFILDESKIESGDIVGTLNGDHYAAAVSYRNFSTDGFRSGNNLATRTYHGFVQISPTHRDSFQLNVLAANDESGDIPVRAFPVIPGPEKRVETELLNVGLGYHRILSPGSDLAVSVIYSKTEQTVQTELVTGTTTLEGPQLEVQQVLKRGRMSWVFGAGSFLGKIEATSPDFELEADDEFVNAYAYLRVRPSAAFDLTVGAALERVVSPTGLLVPRDSGYGPAALEFSETRLSPKLGLSWFPTSKTTLRTALYYRLNPAVGRIQTLEPTQVAGFNQFFFEPGGTRSLSYGVGLDHRFTNRFFGGLSLLRRERKIPEAFCDSDNPPLYCKDLPVTRLIERVSRDYEGAAYFNIVLMKNLALAVDYSYEEREFDLFVRTRGYPFTQTFFEDGLRTHRTRPQLRFFMPCGFFAAATGNYFDQRVSRFAGFPVERDSADADFWLVDLNLGYKLPRRFGTIVLRGRNIADREFKFFRRAVEEDIVPAREITLTFVLTL